MGENVYELRTEFVISVMGAARVLELTIIPKGLSTPFPEDFAFATASTGNVTHVAMNSAASELDSQAHTQIETMDVADKLESLMPSRPDLAALVGYD